MTAKHLKILFSMPNASLHGGPAQHLPLLLDGLRPHCDVWTFEFGRKKDGETVWQKISGRMLDLFRLNLAITAFDPDIIHHNSAFDGRSIMRDAPLLWLARSRKVPLLIKIHGSHREAFGNMGMVANILRNYIIKRTERICVLSEAEKKEFEDRWPACKGRVEVVKNIIKPDFFKVQRRESLEPTVLFISRFIKMKGIFDLLEAVPVVLAEKPGTKFIFVGSGPDGERFDRLVAENKLSSAVKHIPHIGNQDTLQYYEKAWCLVFPTYYPEGMPMVVAEAMAAGCPVLTTRTRFSASYMTEGRHCLFAEPGQPGLLARQIIRLVEDNELRKGLSQNAKTLATRFTDREAAPEFLNLYRAMTDNNS